MRIIFKHIIVFITLQLALNAVAQSTDVYQKVNSLWEKAECFDKNNQEDSCLFYRLNVVDICNKEKIYDFLPIAEYITGHTYYRHKDIQSQFKSIPHFKEAARWFKLSNNDDYVKLGLSSIELVSRLYGMLNMQDSIICFINKHEPYLELQKASYLKEVLDILYWKASAYIHLNFNGPGYRDEAKVIQKEIMSFEKELFGEKSKQYLEALLFYKYCLKWPEDNEEISYIYQNAFSIWDTFPDKSQNIDYQSYLIDYLSFLYQSHCEDNNLMYQIESELNEICNYSSTPSITKIKYYNTESQYYTNMTDYFKAELYCNKAIKEIENSDTISPLLNDRLVDAYLQRARIRFYANDLSSADSLILQAQRIILRQGNINEAYAKSLLLQSQLRSDLGDFDSAKKLGKEGIFTMYNCNPEKIDPYDVAHLLRLSYGEDKINSYYEYSNLLKKTINYNLAEGDILKYLAEGYSEVGEYNKADSVYQQAYELLLRNRNNLIYRDNDRWNSSISTLNFSWGKNHLRQRKVESGIKCLENSVVNNMIPFLLVQMYAYNNNNEFEEAAKSNFFYTIDQIKKHFMFLSNHEQELFMLNLGSHLLETESLAAILPHNECASQIAFDASLLHKEMALNSYLNTKKYFSNFPELENDLNELDSLRSLFTKAQDDESRLYLNERISNLEKKIQRFISSNSSVLTDIFVKWEQIRNSLNNNEIAIEFILYSNNDWPWIKDEDKKLRYGALLLRHDYDCPKFVDIATYDSIHMIATTNKKTCLNDSICMMLWGPLKDYIANSDIVYFSPIYDFHVINLEALGNKLFSNKFIRLSSSRILCSRNVKNNKNNSVVLYGNIDYGSEPTLSNAYTNNLSTSIIKTSNLRGGTLVPLPETQDEIDMIQSLFPQNTEIICYSQKDATEESIKSLSKQQVSILHIATHGFSYGDNSIKDFNEPMRKCGLLFAGAQRAWSGNNNIANREDGILLGEEIAEIDLKDNDMVVLSACDTGLGELSSEGVWGLQRAFKKAGANSILMSLWKVDDLSTRLFMTQFYRYFISGKDKQESLKLAQNYIREYKDENGNLLFEDPSYWASWILLDALN